MYPFQLSITPCVLLRGVFNDVVTCTVESGYQTTDGSTQLAVMCTKECFKREFHKDETCVRVHTRRLFSVFGNPVVPCQHHIFGPHDEVGRTMRSLETPDVYLIWLRGLGRHERRQPQASKYLFVSSVPAPGLQNNVYLLPKSSMRKCRNCTFPSSMETRV